MISKRKLGIACLILIAIGIISYFAISSGNVFTGMNVLDNDNLDNPAEEKPAIDKAEEKIVQEVKNLVEESGNGKIIILVKQDDKEKVAENVKELGGEIKGAALDYIAIEVPADKVNELADDNSVLGVYADRKYYATLDKSVGLVNAEKFWSNGYTGAGVKIAILDTGIDERSPMLRGKVIAAKVFTDDNGVGDVRGHGTHIAGVAAGKYNNEGFNGVAKDALLMNGKVLNDAEGSGMTLQIVQGIEWAVDPDNNASTDDGADVISMSLGGAYSTPDQPYIDAVKYAIRRNVVVVVAAGNCGQCASSSCGGFRGVTVPGSIKEVITVGAVDDSKNVACFSSGQDISGVGIKPDIVAPGVQIASSVPGGYGNMSGTSMAAPHVAGVAALLLGKNPGYGHEQVKHLLEATADDLGVAGKDTSYGSGFVNLEKAYSFDIGNLLEYDVGFNARIVKGEMQRIHVKVFDDIGIGNVSLQLDYPNGDKKEFTLSSLGNKEYEINISNLGEGHYSFNIVIIYGPGFTAARSNDFDVVASPAYSGEIMNIEYNKNIVQGENFNINVSFTNFNSTPLRTFVELQILKDDEVVDSFTSNAVDVESGLLNESMFVGRDAEDDFGCKGDFTDNNCSQAVDEDWESAASTAASSWDKVLGCVASAYVYENFTLGALSNINLTLKTNLANNFSCTIPFTAGKMLQLRTRLDVKNNACMAVCTFAMTEHYYGCPADYWNGNSWIPASGGFNQLDESGCKKEITQYYEGKILYPVSEQKRSAYDFNIQMPVNISPGNYSLKIIAYYEGGQDVENGFLYVKDLHPPIIKEVNFSNELIEDSPLVIKVGVEDTGDVKGVVSVTNQAHESFNINLAGFGQGFSIQNSFVAGSFLDTKPGEYTFNFSVCDESGNCADSENYNFSVEECGLGKKILFVYNDEPELLNSFQNNYCIAEYSKEKNPELSIDYLKRFDVVVLNSGNSMQRITENDALALIEYAAMNRSILLEGADIAFQYGDNKFMREVAHAVLLHDLSFASSSGVNDSVYLINHKNFPLTSDLTEKISFDAKLSSYPDSLQAVNHGVAIASWGDGKAAIVVHEQGAKTLFIPFSVMALNPGDREELLNESLAWLTDDTLGDLKAEILLPGYLVEGGNWFTLQMESDVPDTHKIEVLIDGEIVESRTIAGKGINQITIQKDFERGNHTVIGKVNADFTARERYYLNNYVENPAWVAGKKPEIVIENINYTFAENKILVRADIVNRGGSDLNFTVSLDVNGSVKSRDISLPFSWMTSVRESFDIGKGVYPVSVRIDADDENQENNALNFTVYLCSKTPVLVVDDYDEGFATHNPGSAGFFEEALKQEGYCVNVWVVKDKGYPSNSYLAQYPAVMWSRGDYFGNKFNDSVMAAITSYSGNLLFEGADLGFDGNNALFNSFGAEFSRDIILRDSVKLRLSNHSLLQGIQELEINDSLSPYPDSAKIVTAENVAGWDDGKAAIAAYQIDNKKKVYLGFSIDALAGDAGRKLVVNALNWFGEGGEVIREFSDGKQEKYFGLNEGGQEAFVDIPKGKQIQSAGFFISSGRILADEQKLDKLNDNSTSDVLELSNDKNISVYVRLPKNAVVIDAGYELELQTSPASNEISSLKVESSGSSGVSVGSSLLSQDVGEQSYGGDYCTLSGYDNCYEVWRDEYYNGAHSSVRTRIGYRNAFAYNGNLGGFTGYYVVGPIGFDYSCTMQRGDGYRFYYDFNKLVGDFNCDNSGCSESSSSIKIGTLNVANPGSYFDKVSILCWGYDEDSYNGYGILSSYGAGFNNIGWNSNRVYSLQCYSDSDCGQGRKCYKNGAWDTWHCGDAPKCNSNAGCGNDGWAGTPECSGNKVNQEYKINYCNNPGMEDAYCSFSTDTRVKLTCSNGQYCSSGNCYAAVCSSNSDCGVDDFTNIGYCKDGDVYRGYTTNVCNNPGTAQANCTSNPEQRLIQDCTAREICEGGGCRNVACFADSECGVDGFIGENYCGGNKVFGTYKNYTCNNPGLASASCLPAENAILIKECSSQEYCFSGQCVKAVCSEKSDCGEDGFIGEKYCKEKSVYQKYRTSSCLSGGNLDAKCDLGYEERKLEDCGGACFKGMCVEGVENPRVYIGNALVWQHDGKFTGPAPVNGLVNAINNELGKCETDYCDIAIKFDADTSGSVGLSNINISYYIDKGYPGNIIIAGEDVALKIGGNEIWSNPGRFEGQTSIRNLQEEVNAYLKRCQANIDGYCRLPLSASGKKGVAKINNLQLRFSGAVDMDYDGIVDVLDDDKDNDGVDDAQDKLLGGAHEIKTNIPDLVLDVENVNNIPKYVIEENNKPVLEFSSENVIDLSNISIVKQDDNADNGYVIVKGLTLDGENTKNVYVDRLMNNATGVCVKDAEISSINEISGDCSGADELYLPCNGFDNLGYKCEIIDGKYKISGLKHSGVVETNTEFDFDSDGYYSSEDCDDTNMNIHPGAAEVCNNKDDDCDGSVDENIARSYGATDLGVCEYGIETCNAGAWSVTTNAINATAEICDNKDNDCDNSIDEEVVQTQNCGVGVCGGGIQTKTCSNGNWPEMWGICSTQNKISNEICDGLDNDCDGEIDDKVTKEYGATDIGECSYGVETCSIGVWRVSVPAVNSSKEICDNKDNDCNGNVDEDLIQQQSCGLGVCSGGVQTKTCSAGVWPGDWGICSTQNKISNEVCDNLDNDCNGIVDEALTREFGNYIGICRKGKETCSEGKWKITTQSKESEEEICDGKDNDCDGNVDEDVVKTQSCGLGVCSGGVQTKTCNNGAWPDSWGACSTASKAGSDVCDGLDNDCDGSVDEELKLNYYEDGDGDGYGNSEKSVNECSIPKGYSSRGGDCNDNNGNVHALVCGVCGGEENVYYRDEDGDGFGNKEKITSSCQAQAGYVANSGDCDDSDKGIYESINGVCGGALGTYYEDKDKDGFGNSGSSVNSRKPVNGYVTNKEDCDDNDKNKNVLVCNVCGGSSRAYYKDGDGDGYGSGSLISMCPEQGLVSNNLDCDDSDKAKYAFSICGKCGGETPGYYKDNDGDGYGDEKFTKIESCTKPEGNYVSNNYDCNDKDASVHHYVCNVCGGSRMRYYKDNDWDGYGSGMPNDIQDSCDALGSGYSINNLDCDDGNKELNPGQKELCNQKDDNCDGGIDEDLRVDGGWSAWGDFMGCNAVCGGGVQTRTRICNNPAPFCGGKQCGGSNIESLACNTMECTSLSMKANINTLLLGESFNIEWDAKGAFVCGASGDWSGKLQPVVGSRKVTPENVGLRRYVIDCFNIVGDVIASQTIQVNVEQPGDFDKDSCVDLEDFFLFANHYGLKTGEDLWDAVYDLDKNSRVDLDDFFKFAEYYGKGNCRENVAAKRAYISQEQLAACKNPSQEKCNNLDDNCNGEVDENACNLKSDFNSDGCVDYDDFFLFGDNFGGNREEYDLNSDKIVDMLDYDLFYLDFGKGC